MEDTQVNKTDRQADIQTDRQGGILLYLQCTVSVSHDKNYKQKQDSNREKKDTNASKHTRLHLDLYNQPNATSDGMGFHVHSFSGRKSTHSSSLCQATARSS